MCSRNGFCKCASTLPTDDGESPLPGRETVLAGHLRHSMFFKKRSSGGVSRAVNTIARCAMFCIHRARPIEDEGHVGRDAKLQVRCPRKSEVHLVLQCEWSFPGLQTYDVLNRLSQVCDNRIAPNCGSIPNSVSSLCLVCPCTCHEAILTAQNAFHRAACK
jgi:hypothetical protein